MQDIHKFGLVMAALCWSLAVHASPVLAQAAGDGTPHQSLAQVPLYFERNDGQVDSRVTFLARGDGYDVFLTPDGTVLSVAGTPGDRRRAVVRMTFLGARLPAAVTGGEKLPGVVNYFVGRDPARWRSQVPTYAKVHYTDLYQGVDAVFYGQRQQFEYDLVVAPGADPGAIAMHDRY